jgi:hypothetical protein
VVQQQYQADIFPGVFRQATNPLYLKTVKEPREILGGQQQQEGKAAFESSAHFR